MSSVPQITVQLVHIHGPLKGQIQELTDSDIRIGRHPDCQVTFPKDEVILSRQHARIVREGNRFKLVDESTNGTYVNGQRITEVFLKDGDVITFSESGPKVSFLTRTGPGQRPEVQRAARPDAGPAASHGIDMPPPIPPPSESPGAVESVRMPLALQYGVTLKSFQVLPITIGKGGDCDFIIDHPALQNRHLQIFFARDQYWVKDLTGMNMVMIDGRPVEGQAPLRPESRLTLGPQGPAFRFMAAGRLVELEAPRSAVPAPPPSSPAPEEKTPAVEDRKEKKAGALFKKFFT